MKSTSIGRRALSVTDLLGTAGLSFRSGLFGRMARQEEQFGAGGGSHTSHFLRQQQQINLKSQLIINPCARLCPGMTPDELASFLSLTVAAAVLAGVIGIGIWLMRREGEVDDT